MSEPTWLTYTGAITGVIGTITGITGAIMGYVSYRRTKDLKSLDLRLELRKAETDLRNAVQELSPHLDKAKKSRTAVAAAIGHLSSGIMTQWLSDWETDIASARTMMEELPDSSIDYKSLDYSALEAKLVEVHAALARASLLREKYDAFLAADDKEREQIGADIRSRTHAKLEDKQ